MKEERNVVTQALFLYEQHPTQGSKTYTLNLWNDGVIELGRLYDDLMLSPNRARELARLLLAFAEHGEAIQKKGSDT